MAGAARPTALRSRVPPANYGGSLRMADDISSGTLNNPPPRVRLWVNRPFENETRGLEGAISELDRQLGALDNTWEVLSDSFDQLIKGAASRPLGRALATSWRWDARQPNLYFADCFPLRTSAAATTRWVGAYGVLRWKLILARTLQYDFAIEVTDFASPEYEHSFFIRIDGWQDYGWLRRSGRRYETIILEDATRNEVALEVGIPVEVQSESDVTFSVSRIEITPHG